MTTSTIYNPENLNAPIYGPDADRLLVDYKKGTKYKATDTKNEYEKIAAGTTASSWQRVGTAGSANVLSAVTGEFISSSTLLLSASSQPIPTPPAGAAHALIQIQGGTVTDVAHVSINGIAATTSDMVLRNAEDAVSGAEMLLGGTLTDINILGTAGGSTAVIWWFK